MICKNTQTQVGWQWTEDDKWVPGSWPPFRDGLHSGFLWVGGKYRFIDVDPSQIRKCFFLKKKKKYNEEPQRKIKAKIIFILCGNWSPKTVSTVTNSHLFGLCPVTLLKKIMAHN